MPFTDYEIKVSDYGDKISSPEAIDAALEILTVNKQPWARLPVAERLGLLETMIADFSMVAPSWVKASLRAKSGPTTQEHTPEWLGGPYSVLRNLFLLKKSLKAMQSNGIRSIVGPVVTRPNGKISARVFPTDFYDRMFYMGTTAEVWMKEGITEENLEHHMAAAYREDVGAGDVALVLGAGNVSSIGPMDCIYKLFVEKKVVILKMHPVNAYLGPLFGIGFRALIKQGLLKIVSGDAKEGAYLCNHDLVDEIHITGSDKTHDVIVFGNETNKAQRKPVLEKPVSSELGNVSPLIVVPDDWSEAELDFQAENVVSSLINNAGFNCNATRVLITHREWSLRDKFLQKIREVLGKTPCRAAYYPGAMDRFDTIAESHSEAEIFGERTDSDLPWMFIPGLDPEEKDDLCFRMEAFCGVFGETSLSAGSVSDFIAKATDFANETLWGTLNATVLIHDKTAADPENARALEGLVEELRYGTVSINHWAAMGYVICSTTWGAYPGHDIYDIQSGRDVVHNTYLFDEAEKSVLRGPFKPWPKPVWFSSHKSGHQVAKHLTEFQASRHLIKLPIIFFHALKG
jgi:hypothetical protein